MKIWKKRKPLENRFLQRKRHVLIKIQEWSKEVAKSYSSGISDLGQNLVYADYNHEVMTGFLSEKAWADGKEIAVPKVQGLDMIFMELSQILRSWSRDTMGSRSRCPEKSYSGRTP